MKKSPSKCGSFEQVCRLYTDHKDLPEYWLCVDGYSVSITKQALGNPAEGSISVPRSEFNKLIAWYQRPQTLR